MDDILMQLEREARKIVTAVADDPEGRYGLREAFYAKYGVPRECDTYGFGTSELAFLRWEIARGVLAPLGGPKPGSPWWRNVNSDFLYQSELAALVHEAKLDHLELSLEVRAWLDYIHRPTSQSWYRAHNTSIVRGYLDHTPEAKAEIEGEQLFMNEVLYRLLYAEALVTGIALGELGEIAADPRLVSVDIMVHLPAFYPRHYILSPDEILDIQHLGHGFDADLVRLLDEVIILPHIAALFQLATRQLEQPELDRFVREGVPIYPDLLPAPTPPPIPVTPRKIAILGGGTSALAAAWELTRHEGWKDQYEVTVYAMGWRLGGKTATGRGAHARIEEHGIHILQGWYDTTFQMLARVFDERRNRRLAPRSPFQTWQQGMEPNNSTLLTEYIPGRGWVNWPLIFPTTDSVPGEGPPLSTWDVVKKLVALALEELLGSPYQEGQNALAKWILDHFFPPEGLAHRAAAWLASLVGLEDDRGGIKVGLHVTEGVGETQVLEKAKKLVEGIDRPLEADGVHPIQAILAILEAGVEWLESRINPLDPELDRLRRVLLLVELVLVNLRGILADVWQPAMGTFDWDRINGEDYRAWLRRHGGSKRTVDSVVVRFLYTGTFANLQGPADQGGAVAAGTALRFLLESAGYKGSFVYQFRAGTGDTIIMPIYEVLFARGVKFELFRDVKQIHAPPTGSTSIESITIGEQVTLRGANYDPTFEVGNVRAWPAHPIYGQIDKAQAKELREREINLESPWADWKDAHVREMKNGVEFDDVILAIPVATLKTICSEIYAKDARWKAMVDGVKTTATMSMQLWISPDLEKLGFDRAAWGLAREHCAPNVVVYGSPMYSWLDSTLVRWTERWPHARQPGLIAYYTGAASDPARTPGFDDHTYPKIAAARLEGQCEQWLWDNMGWFWPKGARPEAPAGFDPALLVGPTEGATATEKLEFQYFRANIDPWQRYTLSAPGSAKFRLRTDASGYDNLFLAGDWIDFGMNVGYIEGALVSGMQAGRALRKKLGLDSADDMGVEHR